MMTSVNAYIGAFDPKIQQGDTALSQNRHVT